jgi:uncharacterized membrane protein YdfJ with MMPL/SSD domain
MWSALLAPLILIVLMGVPLLFATFALIQKTGQYIIIMAIVAYAASLTLLPGLLMLADKTPPPPTSSSSQ